MQSSIKRVNIIPSLNDERTEYISEDQIIAMIMNSNLLFANHTNHSLSSSSSSLSEAEMASILSSLPDLLVRDIARFDLSNYVIEKLIGRGGFGTIWIASSSLHGQSSSSSSSSSKVVLKELNDWRMTRYKEFISELLMMNEFKSSKYILQLIGIASPPSPPLHHHPHNDDNDQENENIIIVNNDGHNQQQWNGGGSDDRIKENALLMVIEYAAFGDLASLLQRSKEDTELRSQLTIKLKLRIALNIASALSDLHSSRRSIRKYLHFLIT